MRSFTCRGGPWCHFALPGMLHAGSLCSCIHSCTVIILIIITHAGLRLTGNICLWRRRPAEKFCCILRKFLFFRFLVLVPLSFLHPRLRRWLLERWSSYEINPYYRRAILPTEPERLWIVLDLVCFLWLAVILTLVLQGFLTWTMVGLFYCLSTYSLGLNWIRNLAAHRYANTGDEMSFEEQVEESINIVRDSLLTLLLFPVGLRYHGLHHLFPSLPYHALGEAHRRLMKALPEDSPYRKTCCPGFFTALRDLLRGARLAKERRDDPMRLWRSANAKNIEI